MKNSTIVLFLFLAYSTYSQNTFIENKGQMPVNVLCKAHLPSGALYIEEGKFTYVFYNQNQIKESHNSTFSRDYIDAHSYKAHFVNSNKNTPFVLDSASKYYENYFIGNKADWVNNVRTYKKYTQNEIYDGVDLVMFSIENKLKYELHLQPHANVKNIKIEYEGLESIDILEGDLICNTAFSTTIEHKPFSYQIIDGKLNEVKCLYRLKNNIISFAFPDGYDKSKKLIIDPTLEFSTFSGSFANNFGYTATYDDFGFLYSGSTVFGSGYPTTTGAFQISFSSGTVDIGITKYDTTGTQMIYSTYLGGDADELPHSMVVNSSNELFIFGTTSSLNFPTSDGAYQTNFNGGTYYGVGGLGVTFNNGSDIFVSKLSANGGSLLSSTYIGGSENDGLNIHVPINKNYADEVRGEIDIDLNNNIYIATCTKSADFPVTNSFQSFLNGDQEGCVFKMDNQLSTIVWSTFLGGSKHDGIFSLAFDKGNNVLVTGGTISTDFPTTLNAYKNTKTDSILPDAFVTTISHDGNSILSSTFYGEPNYHDQSYFIELDSEEQVYIYGQTKAPGSSFIYNANYYVLDGGQFITAFSKDLSTVKKSTVFGTGRGTPDISPTAFLVDICGNIYISGWGSDVQGPSPSDPDPWTALSTFNMPITNNAFQSTTTGHDIYLMVIDSDLDSLVYATYLGGDQSREHVDGGTSRFDKKGAIYHAVCAGCGGYSDFPIEPNPGAVSTVNNGIGSACNSAVFKFDFDFPVVVANFSSPLVSCNTTISFHNASSIFPTTTFLWDFGDGNYSNLKNPIHNYLQPGEYDITLTVIDSSGCNLIDSITKKITILSNQSDSLPSITKCSNESVQMGLPYTDPNSIYSWYPNIDLIGSNTPNPICTSQISRQYYMIIEKGACKDTIFQKINSTLVDINSIDDTVFCENPILYKIEHNGTQVIWSSNLSFSDTLSMSESILLSDTGVFYVKSQLNSCFDIEEVNVNIGELELNVLQEVKFCKDSILLESDYNGMYIIWSNNSIFSDTVSTNSDIYVTGLGYYYVKTSTGICSASDSVLVISKNINISLFGNDICYGDTAFIGVTNLNPSVPIISYTWNNTSSNIETIIDTPVVSKWYVVEVLNTAKCILKDSIYINVYDNPKIDSIFIETDSIFLGQQVTLQIETSDMIYWPYFGSNEMKQIDFPKTSTCYVYEVFNEYNCVIKDTICVKVLDFFCDEEYITIPTAFSPNQDGKNETYHILDKSNIITKYKLEIFNRLGQKVFSSTDKNEEWNGTYKENQLTPQIFDFYLEITCLGENKLFKKGNITLIK